MGLFLGHGPCPLPCAHGKGPKMTRICATLFALAATPAFAHSGHGAPASHTHLEEFAVLALVGTIAFIVARAR